MFNIKNFFSAKNFKAFSLIILGLIAGESFAKDSITIGSETKLLKKYSAFAVTTDETARCLGCHATRMPKVVTAWEHSTHAKNGVGCYECHWAEKGDISSKQGHFGFNVQIPVSAARCGYCHQEQYEEFASSKHATAFSSIKDNPIRKKSPILFETFCSSCHGTELKFHKGKPLQNTWPNQGIGRVNTDSSLGNCGACHGFHTDSLAVARDPATCGKCHDSGFSPAMQTWKISAHGVGADKINPEEVDWKKKSLNLADDPLMKPNCQTCHMQGAKREDKATHNVSSRISLNLRTLKATYNDDWGGKRLEMQKSCKSCHGSTLVEQHFRRLDAVVIETNSMINDFLATKPNEKEISDRRIAIYTLRLGVAMSGCVNPALIIDLSTRD